MYRVSTGWLQGGGWGQHEATHCLFGGIEPAKNLSLPGSPSPGPPNRRPSPATSPRMSWRAGIVTGSCGVYRSDVGA